MLNNFTKLLVFQNQKDEKSDISLYTLSYMSPAFFPIKENRLDILAQGSVNSIQVESGEVIREPILVDPQKFEIQFQIAPMKPFWQPLPPIIIKGAGGGSEPQPLSINEFRTEFKFDESDPPEIDANVAKSDYTIEFLIQSDKQIFSSCTIYPDGIIGPPPLPIPLATGFIITFHQLI
jgi:hypothetical protein